MNDSKSAEAAVQEPPPARLIPKKLLIATVCFLVPIVFGFVFISAVEDLLGIGLDMVMLAAVFGGAALMLCWFVWFAFLSGWQWWRRLFAVGLLISLPYGFFQIFRPVNGGDATFVRFEPIWESRVEISVDDTPVTPSKVDLSVETPGDFAQFLGPDRDGRVFPEFQIDEQEFSQSRQIWKQPIGRGWSGFAARNGFAVTMEQREDRECVTCYEIESGELRWIYQTEGRHQDRMNLGRTGPRSTPTIHDGLVYAVGALGNFACLDGSNGSVVWQQDLNELLGIELLTVEDADGREVSFEQNTSLAWGRSGSPLIVDNLVVVPGGGPRLGEKHTLLAFNRLTGKVEWRGGDEMIAYGSPVRATVAGRDQILLTAETKVMGFDSATGEVLWELPRPGESDGGANTSQVTVVSDDSVLTSKGYPDGGGERIRLQDNGGQLIPTSVWKNTRALKTKLMSPVVCDGHAYSFSNAFLECARLSDGERIWKRRGRFGHGQLLLVGNLLLVHSEYGTAYLVKASSEKYEELGSFKTIEGVCWNTLCLYNNRLLVRSELEAACFEIPTVE